MVHTAHVVRLVVVVVGGGVSVSVIDTVCVRACVRACVHVCILPRCVLKLWKSASARECVHAVYAGPYYGRPMLRYVSRGVLAGTECQHDYIRVMRSGD